MPIEVMRSGDAHRQINRLEQLLEMPIACIIVSSRNGQLAFVVPGEADAGYVTWLLRWVAKQAQDGAKSL